MSERDSLLEVFGRLPELVQRAVAGLSEEQLAWAPAAGANSIGWLVWHLTRVQDHHVSELDGADQRYLADGFAERFGLPADPQDIGYGHTPEQVAAVRPSSPALLVEYHRAAHERTMGYLRALGDGDLERIVDERWDPPVTMRVRLVSIASDDLEHAGQASYLRGLLP